MKELIKLRFEIDAAVDEMAYAKKLGDEVRFQKWHDRLLSLLEKMKNWRDSGEMF